MESERRRPGRGFVGIFAGGTSFVIFTALLARIAYLLFCRSSPFFEHFRNDQLYYREWGLRIASGDWLGQKPFEQGPLYAYLLGIVYHLVGPRDTLVLCLQLLCGLGTVVLIYDCARRLWGGRAGLIAGVLAALYGPLIFYECAIMKTFLEPLLVMAALAAGLRGVAGGRPRWFAIAGAAVGLSCLVREVHLILVVPLLVAAMLPAAPIAPPRSRRFLAGGAVLLGFSLLLVPSAVRNWLAAGRPVVVSTAGGENLYLAFGPLATGYNSPPAFVQGTAFQEHEDFRVEATLRTGRRMTGDESSRYWLQEALRSLREAPVRALRLMGVKAVILFNDQEIPDNEYFAAMRDYVPLLLFLPTFGWIVGLGFLGLFAPASRRGATWLATGFAAALILEILLTFNLGRYRAAMTAVWLLFAGGGLAWIATGEFWRKSAGLGFRLGLSAAAVLLTVLAFRPLPGIDPRVPVAEHDLAKKQALESAAARARIPALQRAVDAQPQNPIRLEQLALALSDTGKRFEAIRIFQEVLRRHPNDEVAHFRLAELYGLSGDLERATGHARMFLSLHPNDAVARVTLGDLVMRQAASAADDTSWRKYLDEAALLYQTALDVDPLLAAAHYGLGKARYLLGNRAGALQALLRSRELAPGQQPAADLVRLILERR